MQLGFLVIGEMNGHLGNLCLEVKLWQLILIYYCKHITTYWRIQQLSNLTLSKYYQFSHYGQFTYFILVTLTKFCLFNFIVSIWSTWSLNILVKPRGKNGCKTNTYVLLFWLWEKVLEQLYNFYSSILIITNKQLLSFIHTYCKRHWQWGTYFGGP